MKNKKVKVFLILFVSIALVGTGVFFFQKRSTEASESEPTIDEIIEASIDIPEITTNLAGGDFIKISLKIQGDSKEAAEELHKRDFQVNNLVITELSETSAASLEGKEGKEKFLTVVKTELNKLLHEGEVKEVYITSYIVQ